MTHELDTQINELCRRIIREQDHLVFLNLVTELNQRLEERDKILSQGITLAPKQSDQLLEPS